MLDEMDEDDASDRDTSEDVSYVDTCVRLAGIGVHDYSLYLLIPLVGKRMCKDRDNNCVSKH